jgi:hypothetical protein
VARGHGCGRIGGNLLSELAWRDYAQNVIAQFPDYGAHPAKPAFEALAWRDAPQDLAAWQQGRTGYPIVDAGMREAVGQRLDAQPRADDRGQLPYQAPPHRLAAGRALVLGYAGGCRLRAERRQLAVVGRIGADANQLPHHGPADAKPQV